MPTVRRTILAALLALAFPLAGCDDPRARLVQHAELAQQAPPTGGRAAAAAALTDDFRAGRITIDLVLDHAEYLLQEGKPGAVPYAGAVLDFIEQNETALPTHPEHAEFLLIRIGRLAFSAAETAALAGDPVLARSVVLSGPKRWQKESYWLMYTDHDGLASMLLAVTGDRAQALQRLQQRSILLDEADEAFTRIQSLKP
jgi:hypothetical protein